MIIKQYKQHMYSAWCGIYLQGITIITTTHSNSICIKSLTSQQTYNYQVVFLSNVHIESKSHCKPTSGKDLRWGANEEDAEIEADDTVL